MDILQDNTNGSKKSFFTHVFSTTEEGKSELINVVQYSIFGIIPIVILNKLVQRFIPDADPEKSSLEVLFEIIIQIIVMFCGIVFIHRIITYFPTYSGFKYENLVLTNVILAFLILILSIQTKIGIKVNILFDRLNELWNGVSGDKEPRNMKRKIRGTVQGPAHSPSQSDYLDNPSVQTDIFPSAPSSNPSSGNAIYDNMARNGGSGQQHPNTAVNTALDMGYAGPMAANSLLGSSFGLF